MFRIRAFSGLGLLALLLIVAACSPAATTPTPPGASTAIPATEPFPTPTPEEMADAAGQGALPEASGQPGGPAAPDAYRFDSGDRVGSTGNPQLIEFFAVW